MMALTVLDFDSRQDFELFFDEWIEHSHVIEPIGLLPPSEEIWYFIFMPNVALSSKMADGYHLRVDSS